jgi:hypothetical protein
LQPTTPADVRTIHLSIAKLSGAANPPDGVQVISRHVRVTLANSQGPLGSSLSLPAELGDRDAITWNLTAHGAQPPPLVIRAPPHTGGLVVLFELTAVVECPMDATARSRRGSVDNPDAEGGGRPGRHRRRGSTGSIASSMSSSSSTHELSLNRTQPGAPVSLPPGARCEVACGWCALPLGGSTGTAVSAEVSTGSHTLDITGGSMWSPIGIGELRAAKRGIRRLTGATKLVVRAATLKVLKVQTSLVKAAEAVPAGCVLPATAIEMVSIYTSALAATLIATGGKGALRYGFPIFYVFFFLFIFTALTSPHLHTLTHNKHDTKNHLIKTKPNQKKLVTALWALHAPSIHRSSHCSRASLIALSF